MRAVPFVNWIGCGFPAWLSSVVLVAAFSGWKSWPQTPQVIGPGVYCLARIQNDRGGWQRSDPSSVWAGCAK